MFKITTYFTKLNSSIINIPTYIPSKYRCMSNIKKIWKETKYKKTERGERAGKYKLNIYSTDRKNYIFFCFATTSFFEVEFYSTK